MLFDFLKHPATGRTIIVQMKAQNGSDELFLSAMTRELGNPEQNAILTVETDAAEYKLSLEGTIDHGDGITGSDPNIGN